MPHQLARRTPALIAREQNLQLRRITVTTALGRIVVRAGRRPDAGPRRRFTATHRTATILLHGAAGSWTTWTPVLQASDRSCEPLLDVIAPDLPGWGESGAVPTDADIPRLSAALAEIARSLGYESWRVVGHSLGGLLALDLAAREPSATTGVVLVSGSGESVLDAIRRPVRGGARLPAFAGMLLAMRTLSVFDAVGRSLTRALHAMGLLRPLAAALFADPAVMHRSVFDALAREVRPAAFARAARLARGYDTGAWRAVRCAVTSMRGAHDVFVGERDAASFAAAIRRFNEVVLDDAGHFAHIERPGAILDALTAPGLGLPVPDDRHDTGRVAVEVGNGRLRVRARSRAAVPA